MKLFGGKSNQPDETLQAPYLAMAFFCNDITEDESGLKTFVQAIDTLSFNLKGDELLQSNVWKGKIALEITFGDYKGPVDISMIQTELATGDQETGLTHFIDTTDYPGMLAITLTVDMTIAFKREGNYRYEFFLNKIKRGETALRVRSVRS